MTRAELEHVRKIDERVRVCDQIAAGSQATAPKPSASHYQRRII